MTVTTRTATAARNVITEGGASYPRLFLLLASDGDVENDSLEEFHFLPSRLVSGLDHGDQNH